MNRNVQDFANPLSAGRRLHSLLGWLRHVLFIAYWLEVGVLLLFLPWQSIWENNYFLYRVPQLQPLISNPFLKGAVLGLGIVNIVIGIQEILHFRKATRTYVSG